VTGVDELIRAGHARLRADEHAANVTEVSRVNDFIRAVVDDPRGNPEGSSAE
jgi:hypothetical protein